MVNLQGKPPACPLTIIPLPFKVRVKVPGSFFLFFLYCTYNSIPVLMVDEVYTHVARAHLRSLEWKRGENARRVGRSGNEWKRRGKSPEGKGSARLVETWESPSVLKGQRRFFAISNKKQLPKNEWQCMNYMNVFAFLKLYPLLCELIKFMAAVSHLPINNDNIRTKFDKKDFSSIGFLCVPVFVCVRCGPGSVGRFGINKKKKFWRKISNRARSRNWVCNERNRNKTSENRKKKPPQLWPLCRFALQLDPLLHTFSIPTKQPAISTIVPLRLRKGETDLWPLFFRCVKKFSMDWLGPGVYSFPGQSWQRIRGLYLNLALGFVECGGKGLSVKGS